MKKRTLLFGAAAVAAALTATGTLWAAAAKPVITCPQKPDPPPVIDGDPNDWEQVPCAIVLDKSHVTWGQAQYQGEEDLSGTVRLCFDSNYLYLLVEVIDEVIKTASDKELFLSDHIELDFAPVYKENGFGPKPSDWRILGFTPGTVEESGDPLADMEADATVAAPPGLEWSGIDTAASITEDGYILEARIPWKVLGVKGAVKVGQVFGVDVHISDSDKDFVQECMTSLNNTVRWRGRRQENILKMVLSGTDGKIKK
ncbi:MAG: hypothetical protein E7052_02540 [Lentisphaerae bacterium]|nr:hypothetical protein [Lentisphaerota bacterium]